MTKNDQQVAANSDLMKALAAGAAAAFRPNLIGGPKAQKELADAYLELKEMIQSKYIQVDVDLLDIGPGSEARQEALAQQLHEAGAAENETLLEQAHLLLDIIAENDAQAIWASEVADPAPQHK